MNMKNVKSIEDYVEENIRHYYNFSNVINESIIKAKIIINAITIIIFFFNLFL